MGMDGILMLYELKISYYVSSSVIAKTSFIFRHHLIVKKPSSIIQLIQQKPIVALITVDDEDNEIYGIIPYVAPEVLQGQKYTKALDIYSFGMIMRELMTGRRPFCDKNHEAELIIEICDGVRPPIVTNAPEGYVELMQKCWHPDPNKRPPVTDLEYKIRKLLLEDPSRPLSEMIKSAESTRNLISQNITLEFQKRRLDDNMIGNDNNYNTIKKIKSFKNENTEYLTKELKFDIDGNENITGFNKEQIKFIIND
ncbi:kinase-like protein [Rhizophagus irregularis]|uniref:Kinase-like protein n=1 Tax=Rhizophagus irregularis TaxID=588596 RepID=A0A2N0RD63_9GLOM|nr:kinase-like protein [Rhizophagus irregularis]